MHPDFLHRIFTRGDFESDPQKNFRVFKPSLTEIITLMASNLRY